jgi:CPA2 family monovalent cation:H+ antiporter-2
MDHSLLDGVLLVLAASAVAVMLLRRIGLPPILGYLVVGILMGPHVLGVVPDDATIHTLAEVGVVFLLFTIGLEFSFSSFVSMRGTVLGLGGAQVLLSGLAGVAVAHWLGMDLVASLIVGGALAMSSTALVVKQLAEQLELQERHGRIAVGILLFQDLAVVPFLVAIPLVAQGVEGMLLPAMGAALAKAVLVFVIMLVIGRWLLRPLFRFVAASRYAEIFTLAVLVVSLAAAWLTHAFGLSLALGAFLAGMMLAETEYRHQVETDIRPFRDVLLGLFFITIGIQLDVSALPAAWGEILLVVLGLVVGKGVLIVALTRIAGHTMPTAVRSGMILAQGGEFGLAVMLLAMQQGVVAPADTQTLLAAVIFSMMIAPLFIRASARAARLLPSGASTLRPTREDELEQVVSTLHGHVIICGFGRTGQHLAGFLLSEGFDYVALDLDPQLVAEAWEAGEPVYFGDSTQLSMLEAAGLGRARALVITFGNTYPAEQIIKAVRGVRSDIPIIVRSYDDSRLEQLEEIGATEVVPETVESSMMLATHILLRLGVERDVVLQMVETARDNRYRGLRTFFAGSSPETRPGDVPRLATVPLARGSYAIDRRLGELGLEALGVSVKLVRRQGIRGAEPGPDMRLRRGDVLVIRGSVESLQRARARVLRG